MRALTLGYIVARESQVTALNAATGSSFTQDQLASLFSEFLINKEIQELLNKLLQHLTEPTTVRNQWVRQDTQAANFTLTSGEISAVSSLNSVLSSWENPSSSRISQSLDSFDFSNVRDLIIYRTSLSVTNIDLKNLLAVVVSDSLAITALTEAKSYLDFIQNYKKVLDTIATGYGDAISLNALATARNSFDASTSTPVTQSEAKLSALAWLES